MKNSRSFLAVALVATIAFSSCNGSKEYDNAPPLITRASTSATTPEEIYVMPEIENEYKPVTEVVTERPIEDPETIRSGTWFCYDLVESSYLFFDHVTNIGAEVRVNSGLIEALSCTPAEDRRKVEFHSNRYNSDVVVNYIDQTHAELVIPARDGAEQTVKKLTYLSERDVSKFVFYTDEELGEMAVEYYNDHTTRKNKNLKAQCVTTEDAMVQINVHIITGTGDMKIYETYTVNRLDASGTDSQGNVIDLK